MGSYPPQKAEHWIRVLKRLGFVKKDRIGKGKHANKFIHPARKTKNWKEQPNFIIIPHHVYEVMSEKIIKELSYFGFTEKEIEDCC